MNDSPREDQPTGGPIRRSDKKRWRFAYNWKEGHPKIGTERHPDTYITQRKWFIGVVLTSPGAPPMPRPPSRPYFDDMTTYLERLRGYAEDVCRVADVLMEVEQLTRTDTNAAANEQIKPESEV